MYIYIQTIIIMIMTTIIITTNIIIIIIIIIITIITMIITLRGEAGVSQIEVLRAMECPTKQGSLLRITVIINNNVISIIIN